MMKKIVLVSTLCLLVALAGCSSDPREGLAKLAISILKEATSQLSSIKDDLNKAVKRAEQDRKTLTTDDLKDALSKTEALKKLAWDPNRDPNRSTKDLKDIKREIDRLPEASTPEQRKKFTDKFGDEVAPAIDRLNEAQKALDQAVQDAEKQHRTAVQELKNKLGEALGEFKNLTKAE